MLRSLVSLLLLCIFPAVQYGDETSKEKSAKALLEECIEPRNKIDSGVVEFTITTTDANGYSPDYEGLVRSYYVAFSNNGKLKKLILDWKGRNFERTEVYLRNEDGVLRDSGAGIHADFSESDLNVIDPLAFGLDISQLSSTGSGSEFPKSCFAHIFASKDDGEVEEVSIDDELMLKLSFDLGQMHCDLWMTSKSPRRIVKIEQTFNAKPFESTAIRSQIIDGIVYPERIEFVRTWDDKINVKEVLEIKNARFGPIDQSEFAYKTLPIVENRLVIASPGHAYIFSKNREKLRKATPADVFSEPTNKPKKATKEK